MNIDYYLPPPTEEELNLGFKSDYYLRLIPMNLENKYKITSDEFYNWIHHNYSSVFLTNNELSLVQFRKLKF